MVDVIDIPVLSEQTSKKDKVRNKDQLDLIAWWRGTCYSGPVEYRGKRASRLHQATAERHTGQADARACRRAVGPTKDVESRHAGEAYRKAVSAVRGAGMRTGCGSADQKEAGPAGDRRLGNTWRRGPLPVRACSSDDDDANNSC